jgi:hypothetical protein
MEGRPFWCAALVAATSENVIAILRAKVAL